jgi:tetraacyldisaccharide 4'-kinase
VLLVSAIARPETFRRLLIDAGFCRPQTIVGHLVFHDHHVFTAADFQSVKDEVTRLSATAILCTEKDAVKMRDCMAQVPVFVSRQVVCPKGEGDEIFQTVLGLLR